MAEIEKGIPVPGAEGQGFNYNPGVNPEEMQGSEGKEREIVFTGNAWDYFGVWIVNLLLSFITLGIYSAWAKVRREAYFKNNTKIADIGFGYHATGWQILKGRLIAVAILIGVSILNQFFIYAVMISMAALIILIPWAVNSSLRFTARMTSYRNIRFNWHGSYFGTLWYMFLAPFLGIISIVLLPLASKASYSYYARSHSYGTARFTCHTSAGLFYKVFFIGVIVPVFVMGLIFGSLFYHLSGIVEELQNEESLFSEWELAPDFIFLAMTIYVGFFIFIISYNFIYKILCRNLMVRGLSLEDAVSFNSKIHPMKFLWISLSNIVVVLFSFGLMSPWANVRMYRYLTHSTKVNIKRDMNKFIDSSNSQDSSFGEALSDFDVIDVTI